MKKQNISPGTRTWKYCWTHGVCTHASKDCKVKADGHYNNATFQDCMGGSEIMLIKQIMNDLL